MDWLEGPAFPKLNARQPQHLDMAAVAKRSLTRFAIEEVRSRLSALRTFGPVAERVSSHYLNLADKYPDKPIIVSPRLFISIYFESVAAVSATKCPRPDPRPYAIAEECESLSEQAFSAEFREEVASHVSRVGWPAIIRQRCVASYIRWVVEQHGPDRAKAEMVIHSDMGDDQYFELREEAITASLVSRAPIRYRYRPAKK